MRAAAPGASWRFRAAGQPRAAGALGRVATGDGTASLTAILEGWRAVERQLDEHDPGTPDAIRLLAEFERIRDEYMTAFRVRQATQRRFDEDAELAA